MAIFRQFEFVNDAFVSKSGVVRFISHNAQSPASAVEQDEHFFSRGTQ
jgi:hypothetical protein